MHNEPQITQAVLVSVGTIITLILMVNAYFTRKTLEKINAVDVKLAIIITEHNNTKDLAEANEQNLEKFKLQVGSERNETMRYIANMRERLSVLESKTTS